MLTSLDWLTLEVKYLDPAIEFYTTHLDLPITNKTPNCVTLHAGSTEIRLRAPSTIPRGGLHTHYAFSTPPVEYTDWLTRLDEHFQVTEHEFGTSKSLYCYDPDGHCVEIGQYETPGDGITGIFEVVLEVENLSRAEAFYSALGGDPTSRGEARPRIRLDLGPLDIELWEPQLGIADAQGGVHVDMGLTTTAPRELKTTLTEHACDITPLDAGFRIRDPDGHYLTITPSQNGHM